MCEIGFEFSSSLCNDKKRHNGGWCCSLTAQLLSVFLFPHSHRHRFAAITDSCSCLCLYFTSWNASNLRNRLIVTGAVKMVPSVLFYVYCTCLWDTD